MPHTEPIQAATAALLRLNQIDTIGSLRGWTHVDGSHSEHPGLRPAGDQRGADDGVDLSGSTPLPQSSRSATGSFAAIIWRDFAGRGIVESASDQLASRSSSDASAATRDNHSPSIDDSASTADGT